MFLIANDFSPGIINFIIPANTRIVDPPIKFNLVNDDRLEPEEEGLRLVLVVDESKTPIGQVIFEGRQLALLRIDDYDDGKL